MEQQIADLSKTLAEIHTQNKAIQTKMESLDEIKTSVRQLVGWKPEVDKAVNELQGEVRDLRSQVGHLARNPVLSVKPVDLPPILPRPASAPALAPKEETLPGTGTAIPPSGARDESMTRRLELGEKSSPLPPPNKGTPTTLSFAHAFPEVDDAFEHGSRMVPHHTTPRLDCPSFDGENPRAWQLLCENFFRTCWVRG